MEGKSRNVLEDILVANKAIKVENFYPCVCVCVCVCVLLHACMRACVRVSVFTHVCARARVSKVTCLYLLSM